jgi:phytanoyl-CoA hydroxylase
MEFSQQLDSTMKETLTEKQWQEFDERGFVILGRLFDDETLSTLQQRIDDIMLGKADCDYDRIMMQLDSTDGSYSKAGPQSYGHKGATLDYRKIQQLEYDPVYLDYMQRPVFKHICERVYGAGTDISCFRAMFFNKPARKGTYLPWHQDRWNNLDRDPLVTVWTALDPCTETNGAVKLIPGSHKKGCINPSHGSGFMTEEQAQEHCRAEDMVYLELEAGEVALLHNWVMHSSDINRTGISRRGFSTCYMEAATRTNSGGSYPVVFGEGALVPYGEESLVNS